ncbi:MAG TPA: S-adenosylmethionine:tRNA ribosyltransferase-isomerase [Puia sp.]|nr:S-adenosylmethionine:tRNA ribosyltransferase-isomerase [Puia sp.]
MSESTSFPDNLLISEFGYDLPDEKIARYPLRQRDSSKILIWKAGRIEDGLYSGLPDYLPGSSLLVFNNSRVVEARILFQKPSGGQIEIFCLEPHMSYKSISYAMGQTRAVKWTCLIGGASKWKHGQVLRKKIGETMLEARFIEKRTDDFIIEFSWTPAFLPFAAMLHQLGTIPLPPYLKRNAESSDEERYQTIYAMESGSVAAPTAGLHFSENLLRDLSDNGMNSLFLTLHVGAGTFMPVKTQKISEHHMHEEFIEVSAEAIEKLISKMHEPVIAVGTTSLRTLETLYWLGLLISLDNNISNSNLHLDQRTPYTHSPNISSKEALHFLLEWIRREPGKKLITKTRLFIVPGYQFKIVKGLITNFHQPQSTLLMLVAALIGPEWKSVYRWALDNDYRFLSYGDGCLLLP